VGKSYRGEAIAKALSEGYTSAPDVACTEPDVDER